MIRSYRKWRGAILLAMLAIFLAPVAHAQSRVDPVLFEKTLFPENGNYYELIDVRRRSPYPNKTWQKILNWKAAARASKELSFKGVQGRLVHITTPELDSFLRITLRPNTNVWIGIMYNCETSALHYEDGQRLTEQSYAFWHPVDWYRGEATSSGLVDKNLCRVGSASYDGAYMAMGSHRKPYWALVGGGKGWYQFIIEYQTGTAEQVTASKNGTGN